MVDNPKTAENSPLPVPSSTARLASISIINFISNYRGCPLAKVVELVCVVMMSFPNGFDCQCGSRKEIDVYF